ncbi:MAG: acyl-CoA dehydratase activase-related protein [Atopobiaceae bacterium]|nr:2-hydroxyacyl-CoA dehydratase [Atopobiaceae bacterium]MCH4215119.1 2-hydroxyacyl-CoA dehydratase [Atopobiaceae bacterium]MDD3177308.1 acyl-CoA dehydratase activase-related protein [Atopobiaceae bacterium]MDD4381193.1 acyl-CoA dehydratase activase-related protein [Atopobiaceae bacterium]
MTNHPESNQVQATSGHGIDLVADGAELKPAHEVDLGHADLRLGIDVGSTTVKLAVIDEDAHLVYANYQRHHTDIRATAKELFDRARGAVGDVPMRVSITGSGGLLLSQWLDLEFVQEVIASKRAVETLIPQTDVAIELGGEDAKIIYFQGGIEQRMNGTCAGGTGAFIDQMASLLHTDAGGLNDLAKKAEHIYPIASRCGVFAKSDVQPLLNEGAAPADVAASIFQSVANQTVSGLACGHPIRGYVAFLGGPLQYLSELRKRFYVTLDLDEEHRIVPENAHLFVACGAALAGEAADKVTFADVIESLENLGDTQGSEVERLDPLFADQAALDEFHERHDAQVVPKGTLDGYHGRVFIGIDAGSTTLKAAMVGEAGQLLHTWYGSNNGDVLGTARTVMDDFYDHIPDGCTIGHVTTTGYGEALLIEALQADSGEIETVAHLRGAKAFIPQVEFILDIGGQDMKCLQVKDGVIEHIMLNEACSSGCGSFIESFANAMDMSVQDFAKEAVAAKHPVDLGSRCTVFMNSRVKQAQKEGATVGDIAAGLSYSVIKNALFKVIKLRDFDEIGKYVVVQGGTFMSDATLRAFELLTGRKVIRPDIAGCMGAYGAALLARDRAVEGRDSSVLSREGIDNLTVKHMNVHCGRCSNNCLLTVNDFGGGHKFITGNRCEKGAGHKKSKTAAPNLFEFKNKLLFDRDGLAPDEAPRGTVGIPRALNMYENYPFWHAFFTKLGFSVVLSDQSTKATYEAGIESMPSESVCYPAKLSHGHIMNLLAKDPDFIWMPCIRWERTEDEGTTNHYNCPIVMSYPQSLGLNVDELADPAVEYLDPFIPYDDKRELKRRLYEVISVQREADAKEGHGRFKGDHITRTEVDAAVNAAWAADEEFHDEMHRKGDEALEWMEAHDAHGIVLAGRPYHNDPEINHAIPELVNSFGFAVLTEDSVAHKMLPERPIRVVDQWMYHARLYRAARFVATRNDLDLIQLNSFGCGLDALTTDEVQEILESSGKIYTVLKIDEVSNLGAARIRIRSLMAALKERREELVRETEAGEVHEVAPIDVHKADGSLELTRHADPARRAPVYRESTPSSFKKVRYTEAMQEAGYTILCPQMAPIHFDLVQELLKHYGYNIELLPSVDRGAVDAGLKYVNNDICYPSILTVGQIMEAIESGRYDLTKTAVLISQTGGGCRATNYIALIRKALKDSGHPEIPVISLSVAGNLDEKNPGFNVMKPGLLLRAIYCLVYGDLIMQLLYRVRPYETKQGSADALYDECMGYAKALLPTASRKQFYELCQQTVDAFQALPLTDDRSKPRVGVVGEILVKFHPTANNQVVRVIEREGCEANVPGLVDFFLFGLTSPINMEAELGSKAKSRISHMAGIRFIDAVRAPLNDMLAKADRFEPYEDVFDLADKADKILSLCNTMGEGWLLTAEMVDLIETGTPNIICCSPFACLPNHVVGKSVIKRLRQMHPESNIVAVDYDPGASEVNQLNRIKLMISVAKENFDANRGGSFRVENPDDPTLHVVAPYTAEPSVADQEINGDPAACGASCGTMDLHLSDEQLARIKAAEDEAAERSEKEPATR